jgi:acyl-coenzyme A synthetase/AMP-(fatty) acid ligase
MTEASPIPTNANMIDYEETRRAYRLEVPEHFNVGVDVVDRWAASMPDAEALFWVGEGGVERHVSYAELAERSNRVASALERLGLERGDRVLVVLPRVVAWWEALTGLFKAGLVAAPGTMLLTARDLAYRLEAGEAAAVLVDASLRQRVDEALAQAGRSLRARIAVDSDGAPARDGWLAFEDLIAAAPAERAPLATRSEEPALLYFTSGTTAHPKMVLHSHASYAIGHAATGRYWLDLRPGDLHWNISDTGWAKAAWSSYFGPLICGATLFIQHSTGRFSGSDILRYLGAYPITTLCGAPTVYRMLVQEDLAGLRCPTLRHCVAAGEPLNPEVIEVWRRATGLLIRDGYGQTETVLLAGNFPPLAVKPGSMGKAAPGIDLAVIGHDDAVLPPGQEGDIAVALTPTRPVGLFLGYWRNPEAMGQSFSADGRWYRTGDRGMVDEDGYFWFIGRADDVILSAGYRIGPFEVESALLEHPAVAESAAVASPDPIRGEIVKAFVVLAAGQTASDALASELQEHVRRVTAPYKYPREVEFVPDLPKTISGKIRRVDLRERERARKRGQQPA